MGTTTSTSDPYCPIPPEAITELEGLLGRSLDGWDTCPPRYASPRPVVEGAWFDTAEVARLIRAIRQLPHTKDRWAGTPFDPEPWQIVWLIAPVFGWKYPDGRRIATELWDEVPRKNGKTSLASRLAILLLTADRQMGAEVYAAATTDAQARQVFAEAQTIIRKSTRLKGKLEVLASLIRVPATAGIFRVLSRIADAAHGLNVSGAVVDEVHLHKKRDLIDAIETGTGARSQPLVIYITTAGDDDPTTIYAEKHGYAIKIAEGTVVDPSVWVVIWAADPKAPPFAEDTFASANPNYPISPTKDYFEKKVLKASNTPSFVKTYLRLHLNIRSTTAEQAWDGAEAWPLGAQMVVPEKMHGTACWTGLVCATVADLSALAVVAKNPEGAGWWCRWRWFLPRASLPDLDRRTEGAATGWVADKRLVLTDAGDGMATDVPRLTAEIREIAKNHDFRELVFDPNGGWLVATPLLADFREDQMTAIYASNPGSALIDWERLLRSGEFNHGGDPIATWQVAHVRTRESSTKVTKIDRAGSAENVCGIAAAELAMRRALLAQEPGKSAYADRGLMTV